MEYTQLPLPFLSLDEYEGEPTTTSREDPPPLPLPSGEDMVNLVLPGWEEILAEPSTSLTN